MTHSEMLAWFSGFLAAKGTAVWTPADFKRVRAVLDEAEKRSAPSAPIEPLNPELADKLKELTERAPKQPMRVFDPLPMLPLPPKLSEQWSSSQCSVCGMKFEGPMGYVCGNANCPSRVSGGGAA